jgi:hypothetical protein
MANLFGKHSRTRHGPELADRVKIHTVSGRLDILQWPAGIDPNSEKLSAATKRVPESALGPVVQTREI